MRRLLAICLVFACLTVFSGCDFFGKEENDTSQDLSDWYEAEEINFEAVLREETFSDSSQIHNSLNDVVAFKNFSVQNDSVTFVVQAPYIYEDLMAWFEVQEDITDELLANEINTLLQGEKQEIEMELGYTIENGIVVYSYTNEYLSAVGCGIREFYTYLYEKVMVEYYNG